MEVGKQMLTDDKDYIQSVELAYLALMKGEIDEALEHCHAAAREKPLGLVHLYLLGLVSMVLKDIGRGIKFFEEGHRRAPNNKEFADALAALTARIGNMSDSIYYAKLSLVTDSDPDLAKYAPSEFEELERNLEHAGVSTYYVDATISYHERNYLECVDLCGKELVVHPDNAECHQLMGRAWTQIHEYDEAVNSLARAAELMPDEPENFRYLGDALMASGRLAEADGIYQDGIQKHPEDVELRNRLIDASAFAAEDVRKSGLGQLTLLSELLTDKTLERPARQLAPIHGDTRFIIGFLINEAVLNDSLSFVESLFRGRDNVRTKFIVYQQYSQPYAGTVTLRQLVDDWRLAYDVDDPTLDLILRNDRLSVLIDLCGSRPGHRQQVLRRKPAPSTLHWLGFPYAPLSATTDGILADTFVGEALSADGLDVPVVSLGEGMVGYGGGSVELETGGENLAPASAHGAATYGAYLDMVRLSESASLWASVLHAAPEARLLLGANGEVYPGTKASIDQLFSDLGVVDRVVVPDADDPTTGRPGFLAAIDILLEARHVSNPSLMCDALWMGVPVVAPVGKRPSSQIARSVLDAAGKSDWIGFDDVETVQIAVDLGADAERLNTLRRTLRTDIQASPLCNEREFAERFLKTLEEFAAARA